MSKLLFEFQIFEIKPERQHRQVRGFVAKTGRCRSNDFLEKCPDRDRAKFIALAKRLSIYGEDLMGSDFKHEVKDIWTFRLYDQRRIPCFLDESIWVCTHGLKKNGRWKGADFKTAEDIRDEYFERKSLVDGDT